MRNNLVNLARLVSLVALALLADSASGQTSKQWRDSVSVLIEQIIIRAAGRK